MTVSLYLLNTRINPGLENGCDEFGNKDRKVDLVDLFRGNQTQTRTSAVGRAS
jgi:hypothetical protein